MSKDNRKFRSLHFEDYVSGGLASGTTLWREPGSSRPVKSAEPGEPRGNVKNRDIGTGSVGEQRLVRPR